MINKISFAPHTHTRQNDPDTNIIIEKVYF